VPPAAAAAAFWRLQKAVRLELAFYGTLATQLTLANTINRYIYNHINLSTPHTVSSSSTEQQWPS